MCLTLAGTIPQKRDRPETPLLYYSRRKKGKIATTTLQARKSIPPPQEVNSSSEDSDLSNDFSYITNLVSVPIDDDESPPSEFDIDDSDDGSKEDDPDYDPKLEPLDDEPLNTIAPKIRRKNGATNFKESYLLRSPLSNTFCVILKLRNVKKLFWPVFLLN